MSQLDDKGLPVWDFDARCEEYCPYDSSAAAITACGMLEVYRHSGEGKYLDDAKRLISALEHFCLEAETGQALLNHGCVGPVFTVRKWSKKNKYVH